MSSISVTYQPRHNGSWAVFLSTGDQFRLEAGDGEAGLAKAREAVRERIAHASVGVECVDVARGSVEWHGLRFDLLADTFGLGDPTPEQNEQLSACWNHYRTNLPPDMKIELYGNRVRIEPGAFGDRGALINAIGGVLAGAVPDDHDIAVGPQVRGVDHAREQFRRACALPVPNGFVRVVNDLAGFEDEGAIGAIYLVLKERWEVDRPF